MSVPALCDHRGIAVTRLRNPEIGHRADRWQPLPTIAHDTTGDPGVYLAALEQAITDAGAPLAASRSRRMLPQYFFSFRAAPPTTRDDCGQTEGLKPQESR
jgi:hypothetical protein